jgi:hypothetical protein
MYKSIKGLHVSSYRTKGTGVLKREMYKSIKGLHVSSYRTKGTAVLKRELSSFIVAFIKEDNI